LSAQRVAALVSIAAVTLAVIAGMVFMGSPAEQRTLRFDERRVGDLRQLSNAVQNHWRRRNELPARADDIVDGQMMTRLPLDPTSGQPYDYRVTEPGKFELCATFSRRSRAEDSRDFWFHEAGRHCFSFDAATKAY